MKTPGDDRPSPVRAVVVHGGVIVFYALLAAVVTFPAVLRLRGAVIGYIGVEDLQQTLWLYWWWKQYIVMLARDLPWWQFPLEFFSYPIRIGMGSFLDFIPTTLLEKIWGFPAYYNVKVLLCLILNAYCCFLLVRTLGAGTGPSLLAGTVFSFNPFFFTHIALGRMEQVIAFGLPLTLLFLLGAFGESAPLLPSQKDHRTSDAVLAGILLGLTSAAYWFYGIFIVIFLAFFILFNLFNETERAKLRAFRPWAALVLAFGVTVAPFVIPYAVAGIKDPRHDPRLRWFEPFPRISQIDGKPNPDLYRQIINDSCSLEYPVQKVEEKSIPLPVTLLAVTLFLLPGRRPWVWIGALAFFYLLSLGPYLKWNGRPLGEFPLPYSFFFTFFPFFTKLGWPSRVIAMVMLMLAVGAGLASRKLLEGKELWRLPLGVLLSLTLVCLMFPARSFPIASSPFLVPGFYEKLAAEREPVGVIELPASSQDVDRRQAVNNVYNELDLKNANFLQILHGRKVLWGQAQYRSYPAYPAEEPPYNLPPYLRENTFLAWLIRLSYPEDPGGFRKEDLDTMKGIGYRYLVVHERHGLHLHRLGKGAYERACTALESKFGKPVSTWVEILWDAPPEKYSLGMSPSDYFLKSWRIAVFEMR